ncbi:SURF1 family protein [Streptomyces mirabilis]|uniref:SURF1 family cytochrome oxidase biogenesis protein n=1 Tax=Streptomyces TaxID=1883 RepID=UPI0029B9F13F|nr:SURF1 family protein [Streptomyces sp. AK02-04a]MDX3756562.1 SURF1 family protein [Streptomyces sp. AK02-04a]
MYRFLLSRQWVILTLVALLLIPTMIKLGFWQLHRHEHKVALNKVISQSLTATPVPAESVTAPGQHVEHADLYRRVTAKGTFDTAHEVVVRRRTNADGEVGYHVLTPFDLDDGRVLLVNRGWIDSNGSQTAFPKIPAPAKGEITVTGRLMPDETTGDSGIKNIQGLPDRQVMLINSEQQAKSLGKQVLGGYIEQTAPAPKGDSPELIPDPEHNDIGPHMAYAIQWWLFSAGVPVGWLILVRRERRDRAEAAASTTAPEAATVAA